MEKEFIKIEVNNINWLLAEYGAMSNILIGVDSLSVEDTGIDLVVYDVTEMIEKPEDIESFKEIVNENGLDEESFEIDRVTLVKSSL